jgi:hypothetical protein
MLSLGCRLIVETLLVDMAGVSCRDCREESARVRGGGGRCGGAGLSCGATITTFTKNKLELRFKHAV